LKSWETGPSDIPIASPAEKAAILPTASENAASLSDPPIFALDDSDAEGSASWIDCAAALVRSVPRLCFGDLATPETERLSEVCSPGDRCIGRYD